MNPVFAGASYFIAFLNPSNRHQATAVRASDRPTRSYVTTRWVLVDFADALSAALFSRRVVSFLRISEADPPLLLASMDEAAFIWGSTFTDAARTSIGA